MSKQVSGKTLLFVLFYGDMMIISFGIVSNTSIKEIVLMIIAFFMIWIVFVLVYEAMDRIAEW